MKKKLVIVMMIFSLFSSVIAGSPRMLSREENDAKNIILITKLYKEFFEKKDINRMNEFFSKQLSFQINFNAPTTYEFLKEHLVKINEECVTLKMLPFDKILVSGSQVITLYTQSCTDKFNKIHKKRILSITEIAKNDKILKIQAVTNNKEG